MKTRTDAFVSERTDGFVAVEREAAEAVKPHIKAMPAEAFDKVPDQEHVAKPKPQAAFRCSS